MTQELPTIILVLALILAFVRLMRGPNLANRVVAFELMTTIGIGLTSVYAVMTNQPVFLDIAVIVALLSFLSTIAFAYYLEQLER